MTKKCAECYGWEDESCANKFSPYFEQKVGAEHTCQQIQTDEENTDVHPSVLRTNTWDTGMRYRD